MYEKEFGCVEVLGGISHLCLPCNVDIVKALNHHFVNIEQVGTPLNNVSTKNQPFFFFLQL